MQLKNILLATALSASASAEFVVFTTPGLQINGNFQSQLDRLGNLASDIINSFTANIDSSALSRAASAHTALASFVATASYDIDDKITELGAYQTYTATPDWYSALPSDLKAYFDERNGQVQSQVNEAFGATPTPTASAGQPADTNAAAQKAAGYFTAGMAAVAAGVFAL